MLRFIAKIVIAFFILLILPENLIAQGGTSSGGTSSKNFQLPIPQYYSAAPPILGSERSSFNMLILGKDHTMFYPAYNDLTDINGDGVVDTGFNPAIRYQGYFDPYLCYTHVGGNNSTNGSINGTEFNAKDDYFYATPPKNLASLSSSVIGINNYFNPVKVAETDSGGSSSVVKNKQSKFLNTTRTVVQSPFGVCNGANLWSGNFLNYLTSTRFDVVKASLYGGTRVIDTEEKTLLEPVKIVWDGHTFGKEVYNDYAWPDEAPYYYLSAYSPYDARDNNDYPTSYIFARTSIRDPKFNTGVADFDGSVAFSYPTGYMYSTTVDGVMSNYESITSNNFNQINNARSDLNTSMPVLRVIKNTKNKVNIAHWLFGGPVVPNDSALYGNTGDNDFTVVDNYVLRVSACTGLESLNHPNSNCKNYEGTLKPVGTLQKYVEDGDNYFSLLSNAYTNPLNGGRMRAPFHKISEEINPKNGIIKSPFGGQSGRPNLFPGMSGDGATPPENGIIRVIDRFEMRGWVGDNNSSCEVGITWDPNAPGIQNCFTLGNPLGEMLLEGMRYIIMNPATIRQFNRAFPAYTDIATSLFNLDNGILYYLDVLTWKNYVNSLPGGREALACAYYNVIMIAPEEPTFDNDVIFDSSTSRQTYNNYYRNFGPERLKLISSITSKDAFKSLTANRFRILPLLNIISDNEFNNLGNESKLTPKKHYVNTVLSGTITNSNNNPDFSPFCQESAENITNFNNIIGLCPGTPHQYGSYSLAAGAYYGHIIDLQANVSGDQNFTFYSVPLPKLFEPITLSLKGQIASIKPVAVRPYIDDQAPVSPVLVRNAYRVSESLHLKSDDSNISDKLDYDPFITDDAGNVLRGTYIYGFGSAPFGDSFNSPFVVSYEVSQVLATCPVPDDQELCKKLAVIDSSKQISSNGSVYYKITNASQSKDAVAYIVAITKQLVPVAQDGVSEEFDTLFFGYETRGIASKHNLTTYIDYYIGSISDVISLPGQYKDTYLTPPNCNDNSNYDNCGSTVGFVDTTSVRFFNNFNGGGKFDNLPSPMWLAAKYGGFLDSNGNGIPDLNSEWDSDGNGIPDNYIHFSNLVDLGKKLASSGNTLVNPVSVGTSDAVLSSPTTSGGLVVRSLYYLNYIDKDKRQVDWGGRVYSLFVDPWNNYREDTNLNGKLDLKEDLVVSFGNRDTDRPDVYLYRDKEGNNVLSDRVATKIEDLKVVWDTSRWLSEIKGISKEEYLKNFLNSTDTSNLPDILLNRETYRSNQKRRNIYYYMSRKKSSDLPVIPNGGVKLNSVDHGFTIANKNLFSPLANASVDGDILNVYFGVLSTAIYQAFWSNFPLVTTELGSSPAALLFTRFYTTDFKPPLNIELKTIVIPITETASEPCTALSATEGSFLVTSTSSKTENKTYVNVCVRSGGNSENISSLRYSNFLPKNSIYSIEASVQAINNSKITKFWSNNEYLLKNSTEGMTPYDSKKHGGYGLKGLISYIRGQDIFPARSREVVAPWHVKGVTGNNKPVVTWRLGDIINSTPVVVGSPESNYDYIYRDNSYTVFKDAVRTRRTMVYFGANDGMLHAVNAGFFKVPALGGVAYFDKTGDEYKYTFHSDQKGNRYEKTKHGASFTQDLGAELWAYVPESVLDHLRWLLEADYGVNHSYYVDLRPKVVDIKNTTGNDLPNWKKNEWKTILIGGLRFGGRAISNIYDQKMVTYPEIFAMDITNPAEAPTLLWRFTHPNLGMPIGWPAVIRSADESSDNWYVVIGSGPTYDTTYSTDREAIIPTDTNGVGYGGFSNQKAKVFVINAVTGKNEISSNNNYIELPEENSFLGEATALDADNSKIKKDEYGRGSVYWSDRAIYFGVTKASTGDYNEFSKNSDYSGDVYRLMITNENGKTLKPGEWKFKKLISLQQPISSGITLGRDKKGSITVYFGTGRLFNQGDLVPCSVTDTAQCRTSHTNYIYGIKENMVDGNLTYKEFTKKDLLDVSSYSISISNYNAGNLVYNNGNTTTTYSDIIKDIDTNYSGYMYKLPGKYESVLHKPKLAVTPTGDSYLTFTSYVPGDSPCDADGTSFLYLVDAKTGLTPFDSCNIIGCSPPGGGPGGIIPNKIELGKGSPTEANVVYGANSISIRGGTKFDKQGRLNIDVPPNTIDSKPFNWREVFDLGFEDALDIFNN